MDVKFMFITLLASIYGLWLINAGGWDFLLISMILYAPGTLLFFYRRREDKHPLIKNTPELLAIVAVVASAVVAAVLLANGTFTI